jgi:hypothetical protein
MAVLTAQTLVLRGVSVFGGKTHGARLVRTVGGYQPSALVSMRHLSPGCHELEPQAEQRTCRADFAIGMDKSADRAGRPCSRAGVPNYRRPALNAGWANHRDWSNTRWESTLAATPYHDLQLVKARITAGTDSLKRLQVFQARPLTTAGLFRQSGKQGTSKSWETGRLGSIPTGLTRVASTRGKGR